MGRKPRAEDYYAILQRNRALAEELSRCQNKMLRLRKELAKLKSTNYSLHMQVRTLQQKQAEAASSPGRQHKAPQVTPPSPKRLPLAALNTNSVRLRTANDQKAGQSRQAGFFQLHLPHDENDLDTYTLCSPTFRNLNIDWKQEMCSCQPVVCTPNPPCSVSSRAAQAMTPQRQGRMSSGTTKTTRKVAHKSSKSSSSSSKTDQVSKKLPDAEPVPLPGRPRRAVSHPVSYAEPSLNTKVRKGHRFFIFDHSAPSNARTSPEQQTLSTLPTHLEESEEG